MFPRVTHKLCRRIKAHGLGIKNCGAKHVRIVTFQPTRDVGDQCETRSVAFGKSVVAKTLNLSEAGFSEIFLVAIGNHSSDHFLSKCSNGADPAKRGHRTTQPIGFGRCESCSHDGYFHCLFLKQGYAKSFVKDVLQFLFWIGHGFKALSTAKIGMDHVSLDRTGTDYGHFNDQVVEFPRFQTG